MFTYPITFNTQQAPGGLYSTAVRIYSVRRVQEDYSGPLIRVRRSSDNAEQDIGYDANGDLDTSSLLSFVGAGDGFVTTWYDQTGTSNAVQSTQSRQPKIVSSGAVITRNNKPAVYTPDGTDQILVGGDITPGDIWTFVAYGASTTNLRYLYSYNYPGGNYFALDVDASSASALRRVGGIGFMRANYSSANSIIAVRDNDFGEFYQNGALRATKTFETYTSPSLTISLMNFFGNYSVSLNAWYHEFIFFESDQSAKRSNIETDINSYYSIY